MFSKWSCKQNLLKEKQFPCPKHIHLKSQAVPNLYLLISLSAQIGVVLLFTKKRLPFICVFVSEWVGRWSFLVVKWNKGVKMKLFSNLDLIFHHIREVSCLSFPGILMKWHCALWRVHWLCIMLRLLRIFLLWVGFMIYFKIVILLCLQSLQLILALPLPLPFLPHTCPPDQSFLKNKASGRKHLSFVRIQFHW